MTAGRVLLLSLPFSALFYPSIGLSLLKPAIEARGIGCDIGYLHLSFADRIGSEAQEFISAPDFYQSLVGDWVFAPFAHLDPQCDLDRDMAWFTEVVGAGFPRYFTPDVFHTLLRVRAAAEAFIAETAQSTDVGAYDVIGFTSSFQQNAASLGLARLLKARRPDLVIAFGGANCRAELGLEMLRRYDFIDAVCTGEGDTCFPEFVARVCAKGGAPCGIDGMAVRGEAPGNGDGEIVADLDALPAPDFDDFFAQHAASPVASANYKPVALFETSRGCWWGEKHHCTFCGINGRSMAYRRKSADGAIAEIVRLVDRYGPDLVNVDAILDTKYFDTLLPRLATLPKPITVYYELKANLKPEQFAQLARAGILKIQPGLESLDNTILAKMRKGCTAIQNVQTLKLGAEHGLFVEWNFLTGFPGEQTGHYRAMATLIPRLMHLQAPNGVGQVRADRFSPYFEHPARFGATISPNPAYRFIYPPDDGDVAAMAYHFQIDTPTGADPGVVSEVERLCHDWQAASGKRALGSRYTANGLIEVFGLTWRSQLDAIESAVIDCAWTITTIPRIARESGWTEMQVAAAVERLDDRTLVMRDGDQLLALPLRRRANGMAPRWDEIQSGTARMASAA